MTIKCHSAFVHYNMFHDRHNHCGGNNYGSIFNITHNCGGGTSFWGGLGAGIGLGLGNIIGGLFGNFMGGIGNVFGGFGFGGFGGFGGGLGLGGFGGLGNGLSALWGGGAGNADRADNDYSKYASNKYGKCTCGCDGNKDAKGVKDGSEVGTADANDKNYDEINAYDLRGNALLKAKPSIDNDKLIDTLVKELKAYKPADGVNDNKNQTQIDQLIERLENHKTTAGQASEAPVQPVVTPENKPTVKINGQDVELENLTPEQIKTQLTKEQIDGLKPDEAKALLVKLNLICKDDSNKDGVAATTNLNALRLTAKADLPLACGHNTSLDAYVNNGALPYISGMISNIEYNETTKIIKFHLEDEKGKYEMQCTADSDSITLIKEIENKDAENYEEATKNITYTIVTTDNDPYAVRTGKAAKKKKKDEV